MNKNNIGLAVAQMGPVHLTDSRAEVVRRLMEMMREAKARQSAVVVFPELALTTFFPRYWMGEEEAHVNAPEARICQRTSYPLFGSSPAAG